MKGKEKCEFLKGIRKRMAEANEIPYEPRECTYEGECTGTCPFCEKEAAELMAALKKKEAEGAEIKKDDVGMSAIVVDKEPLQTPIDPFRGSNNPFMSEKDLRELRKYRHREREPLMGDVPSPEELRRIEERERLRREEESRREIEKREKRDKGFLNKVINRIKSFFEPTLMGEVEI